MSLLFAKKWLSGVSTNGSFYPFSFTFKIVSAAFNEFPKRLSFWSFPVTETFSTVFTTKEEFEFSLYSFLSEMVVVLCLSLRAFMSPVSETSAKKTCQLVWRDLFPWRSSPSRCLGISRNYRGFNRVSPDWRCADNSFWFFVVLFPALLSQAVCFVSLDCFPTSWRLVWNFDTFIPFPQVFLDFFQTFCRSSDSSLFYQLSHFFYEFQLLGINLLLSSSLIVVHSFLLSYIEIFVQVIFDPIKTIAFSRFWSTPVTHLALVLNQQTACVYCK